MVTRKIKGFIKNLKSLRKEESLSEIESESARKEQVEDFFGFTFVTCASDFKFRGMYFDSK